MAGSGFYQLTTTITTTFFSGKYTRRQSDAAADEMNECSYHPFFKPCFERKKTPDNGCRYCNAEKGTFFINPFFMRYTAITTTLFTTFHIKTGPFGLNCCPVYKAITFCISSALVVSITWAYTFMVTPISECPKIS